jgi:hypothetical protein
MWLIQVFILIVQMSTLNVMGPASFYYAPYGGQLEQQQSSSCPSVQEQYIPADTGFMQPIGPIATRYCDIANSEAYGDYPNTADPYGTLLNQQTPSVMGQIVPAVEMPARARLTVPNIPVIRTQRWFCYRTSSHQLHPPPSHRPTTWDTGHPTLPDLQDIRVAPSRVSNSSRSRSIHIIDTRRLWLFRCVLRPPLFLDYFSERTDCGETKPQVKSRCGDDKNICVPVGNLSENFAGWDFRNWSTLRYSNQALVFFFIRYCVS